MKTRVRATALPVALAVASSATALLVVLALASSPPAPNTWMHEDFESYNSTAEMEAVWRNVYGGLDLGLTGGWDGPKCLQGAKGGPRRQARDLVPLIQAALGGQDKTSVAGRGNKPLIFEGSYFLDPSLDVAIQQVFWFDLYKGNDYAPRGQAANPIPHSALGFGAFGTLSRDIYAVGLRYYDGLNWRELTSLKHGPGWNYLIAVIRETNVHIVYYDEAETHGIQSITVPRVYVGDFDTIAANTDNSAYRVRNADSFKLSGGKFLPETEPEPVP